MHASSAKRLSAEFFFTQGYWLNDVSFRECLLIHCTEWPAPVRQSSHVGYNLRCLSCELLMHLCLLA